VHSPHLEFPLDAEGSPLRLEKRWRSALGSAERRSFGSILGFVRLSLGVLHMFGTLADTMESVIMPGRALKMLLTNLTLTIAVREPVHHDM
jgi:hypothetical protein